MVVVDAAVQGASEPAFEQGHTAGLTQEAPIGNSNELDPGSFDAHVRSISDTWLRFPVGSGYAYSNLGIDLAGYILERVEDKPFAAVMRDSLLGPLGMDRSTFDRTAIRSTSDRAVGHADPYPEPPVEVPMTAAGGPTQAWRTWLASLPSS